MPAPVILFAYNREMDLRETLKALEKNVLTPESDIYVFSDGAVDVKDQEAVNAVRKYLEEWKKHTSFHSVWMYYSENHRGLACSVIDGVNQIIHRYGSAVIVEDDIVTSPDFLNFMNDALEFYANDNTVWSVSGYTPILFSLKKYDKDVFKFSRAASWGWATWANRWDSVDWDVSDYEELCGNKEKIKMFNRGGSDLFPMLQMQMRGEIDSWAIRFYYEQSKVGEFCIYPKKSRVQNIGFYKGTHFKGDYDGRYDTKIDDDPTPYQLAYCEPDKKITIEFRFLYSRSIINKIWRRLRRLLIHIDNSLNP